MSRKIALWALWAGFVAYATLLAPPDRPETLSLIQDLSTGHWEGINPLVSALFNIMGVFPVIYSALLFIDGRMQKLKAWVFVLGSFALGAFALLPYLALRDPNQEFSGKKGWLINLLDSRWTGALVAIGAFALVVYGFTNGDWNDFVQQWRTSRFIHVMSLDFCLMTLLFPTLLGDDMARRNLRNSAVFWLVSLIPILGPAAYLALRPPLKADPEPEVNLSISG